MTPFLLNDWLWSSDTASVLFHLQGLVEVNLITIAQVKQVHTTRALRFVQLLFVFFIEIWWWAEGSFFKTFYRTIPHSLLKLLSNGFWGCCMRSWKVLLPTTVSWSQNGNRDLKKKQDARFFGDFRELLFFLGGGRGEPWGVPDLDEVGLWISFLVTRVLVYTCQELLLGEVTHPF